MRKLLNFLSVFLLLNLSFSAFAQTEYTAYQLGFIGGQYLPPAPNNTYSYSTSNIGSTNGYITIIPNECQVFAGFPYNVQYFTKVFDRRLFVSKGYFANYVQVRWNVARYAGSIKRFKIYRKEAGSVSDSLLVASVPADVSEWKDEFAERGVVYEYTLFAEGLSDNLRIPYVNIMQGNGFAMPTGRVSGRITFEGGTAVEGVSVLAETEGSLAGKSIELNGTDAYLSIPHLVEDKELEINTGFTFQSWVKYSGTTEGTIFSKDNQYNLSVSSTEIMFKVADAVLTLPFTIPVDSFFHITATYNPGSELKLYVHSRSEQVDSAQIAAGMQPLEGLDNILIGKNSTGNFLKGYVDEMRLWNTALSYATIVQNYDRYINGTENNLVGYWRVDEGRGNEFYDFSRKGFNFNENHAFIHNGSWSLVTPLKNQLAFKGVTDASGNYTISGFPYETDGSIYKFTPTFGVHSFDPVQQIRLISDQTSVINELNFTDISSFRVTGTVKYKNTNFPVEGVSILVDGKPATNRDGQLITTDNLGRFEVNVAIGKHSLKLSLNGHIFENEGRFPVTPEGQEIALYDFQSPLSGLEFLDATLIRVAGRVVGGPVEAAKLLGFGQSKNNIGNATISLTTEKGYDITLSDSSKTYTEEHFESTAGFSTKNMKIYPDANTGEYIAYLLPERYKVTSVTAGVSGDPGQYIFGENALVSINLKSTIKQNEVLTDTLGFSVKGVVVPYPPFVASKYDTVFTSQIGDTTWTLGSDTFSFDQRQDFIYRAQPVIEVKQLGVDYFGDESFTYENSNIGIEEEIPLVNNGVYTFGYPAFNDRKEYIWEVSLFEQYTNTNTDIVSNVPVTDGKVEINNNLELGTGKATLEIDEQGKALYKFKGGFPEISKDLNEPEKSFTSTINVTAFSGNNGSIRTIWREGDPFRAFLFGGLPVGADFVTTGPTQITTILRDPPGSNSKAYLEKGSTFSTTTSWAAENAFQQEAEVKFKLGATVKTWAGIGAGIITETEYNHDIAVGLTAEERWISDYEKVTTTTTTKRWETSDDIMFVGDRGDVFVGHATAIVYGRSVILELKPVVECTDCIPGTFTGSTGEYSIGLTDGLRLNPEITTTFMHTQAHIEEVIIPNLKNLRNSFLEYTADPTTVQPKVISSPSDKECTNNAIYLSLISPQDTLLKYGSSNSDTLVWGNLADTLNLGKGPSYKIIAPVGCDAYYVKDTIQYFNQQLEDWYYWLKHNEKQKVTATDKGTNISFDAGTVYESSVTVDVSETTTQSFQWQINPYVAVNLGFEFNKFGMGLSGKLSYDHVGTSGTGSGNSNSTNYGYTLAENDAWDYYSINVKNANDGYGPVFKINGGATSCPYEGATETKYYLQDGNPIAINPATVPVDAPGINVEEAIVTDVPSNRSADFTLLLTNNNGRDIFRYYTVFVDETTNPYGAILEIDGVPIGNGRTFYFEPGDVLKKTLKVRMGRSDIMAYENIKLDLYSQCDPNMFESVLVSAYFVPGCSDIAMELPKQNWVLNTNVTPSDTLLVKLNNYNKSFDNFKQILFQYKPSGSSQWTTDMIFYNPEKVTQEEYDLAQEPKRWIAGANIQYYWDMYSQPDRNYDIRAKTVCELGPGAYVETPTDIISGIKDVKRPLLFGSPQPADGVVSSGDEISIQFDEDIEASLITPFNFSVQAVLNGYTLNHNTSLDFDGINDLASMNDGLNLSQSFTIEFWAKRNELNKEQVIFSKGTTSTDLIEIGFDAANHLLINMGGQQIASTITIADDEWTHYAVVYDAAAKTVSAFKNDQYLVDRVPVVAIISGKGPIELGRSFSSNRYFNGNLHELRIWSKALQMGDVYAKMNIALNGGEIGLVGYWPFDEANGNLGHDKARYRHATIQSGWLVLPKGKAYAFDGIDDFLELNTGSTVVLDNDMDLTIEFWFKGAAGQKNVSLFSSGKGDGTDSFNKGSWSIGFNGNGQLQLTSNGNFMIAETQKTLLDDNWHHLSISVNRKGNTNVVVDGELVKSQPSAGFGPLYGAKMYLGARVFRPGQSLTTFDQYFNGSIDEFRIWNLSKKQNQVVLAKDAKLSGDELGLMAYYPFEKYITTSGIKVSNPILDDQFINSYGPNGGTAVAYGNADYSDNTPNIKDVRPLQKVDFDWVVNGDKIIITPAPSMAAAIEKSLLEITVSGLEDKYENRMASAVTWTAYMDKNQLKWTEESITLQKKLYDPLTFKTTIINKGGTQQNYVINNLPAWLSASPKTGLISALSSQEITFTIDPGLNTGTYQEDIYLKSDFGFDEKMILNLSNFSSKPEDWKVDSSKFQYSMNIVGQIVMNGKISTNTFDYLAAFVNGECRGIANLQYVEAFDNYQAFITIYSNNLGGEKLEFKFWNAEEGQVYTNVKPEFDFVANSVHGIPSNPIRFESEGNMLENKVKLPQGWKWISFNLYSPQMKVVNNIVKLNGLNGDLIKSKLYFDTYDVSRGWIGSLTGNSGLRNEEMYKVYMQQAKDFTYAGKIPDADTLPISLEAGWNWIGFISSINMTVNEALANLNADAGDIIKGQHNFASYEPAMGWIGNLTYLKPGEGYMYLAQKNAELKYPKLSSLSNARTAPVARTYNNSIWEFNAGLYSNNMNLIATVVNPTGEAVQENDLLAAFVGEECRGVAYPVYNPVTKQYNFFLTVAGESSVSNLNFKFYKDANGEIYDVQENLNYRLNSLAGEVSEPVVLTLGGTDLKAASLYPNPFSGTIDIRVPVIGQSDLKLEVLDIKGVEIQKLAKFEYSSDFAHTVWDGTNNRGMQVSSGVYILRVTVGEEVKNYKMIKY